MKNIQMFLSGGGMPPFTYYLPVLSNTAQPATVSSGSASAYSSSSDSDKGEITDKDLLQMLSKIDGLPSDMSLITLQLQKFYRIKDLPGADLNIGSLSNQYIRVLLQVKTAAFNKKEYDLAKASISKKGGIREAAITEDGKIYTISDGALKAVSVDTYFKSPEKYEILTNARLLDMRALSSGFAFKNDILRIVNNAVSMVDIQDFINKFVQGLGTNSTHTGAYENRKAESIEKGLNALLDMSNNGQLESDSNTLSGIFKVSNDNKNQKEQAIKALNYMYSIMPENYKTLLKLRSKTGTDDNAKVLLSEFFTSHTSTEKKNDVDWKLDASGNKPGAKGSSGSGGKDGVPASPSELFALGWGHSLQIELNPGTAHSFKVNGRFGMLSTKEGDPIGAGNTLQDVNNSSYAGTLDFKNATFGGARLDDNGLNHILLRDADIVRVDLPVERTDNGVIKPDFKMLNKIDEAETEIVYEKAQEDYLKINEIYQKHDLPFKYILSPNGEWMLNNREYCSFAMVLATVDERSIDLKDRDNLDDSMIVAVDDDDARDNFEATIKEKEKKYSLSGGFGIFGGGDELYRGNVFIPIREGLIPASLGSASASHFKLPHVEAKDINTLTLVNQKIVDRALQVQQQNPYLKPLSLLSLME